MKLHLIGCLWLLMAAPVVFAQPRDSLLTTRTQLLRVGQMMAVWQQSNCLTRPGLLLAGRGPVGAYLSLTDPGGTDHWVQLYPTLQAASVEGQKAALLSRGLNGNLSVMVVDLANNRVLLWSAEVGAGGQSDVALLPNGHVVVASRTNRSLQIYTLQPAGPMTQTKPIALTGVANNDLVAVLPLPDGGLVITVGAQVLGFDKLGRMRWQFGSGQDAVRWNRMRSLHNGQVLLVGQGTAAAFNPQNQDGRIMCIDPETGEQKWQKLLGSDGTKEAALDALETPDGRLLVLLQEPNRTAVYTLNAKQEVQSIGQLPKPDRAGGHYVSLLALGSGEYGAVFVTNSPAPGRTLLQRWSEFPATQPIVSPPRFATVQPTLNPVNVYGLAIGVSVQPLKFTTADASAVADAFGKEEGRAFGKVTFEVLNTPERSTAGQMAATLERWSNGTAFRALKPQAEDWLIVFVSGMLIDAPNDLRLVGSDYDPGAPRSTSLSLRALLADLNTLPGRKLVLLDAGQIELPKSETAVVDREKSLIINPKQFPNTYVLAASQFRQLAYEDAAWQHGAFTKALLDALTGAANTNKDGQLRLSELYAYLSEHVPVLVRTQKQREQQPIWLLRPGDEVLLMR